MIDLLCDFWLNDTPALHGRERILLYSTLLVLSLLSHYARPPLGDSPLQAPELLAKTNVDLFFERRGLVEFVPHAWLRPGGICGHSSLHVLRVATIFAWLCAILGVFGHTPVVLTAVGFFLLEMFKVSCFGVGHRWYLVVYTLFFLCLADARKTYSVDAYLVSSGVAPHWPFDPSHSHPILSSGLATKLGLVATSFTLWSGALTKARGLKRTRFSTICIYLHTCICPPAPFLIRVVSNNPPTLPLLQHRLSTAASGGWTARR